MEPLREQVGSELAHAVIGGHSFGGRVASLVAAQTAPAGLVLLSYPLHRPGHPDELRIEHWPDITCPVLVLSGDRDQFARVDLLRKALKRLAPADVHVYSGCVTADRGRRRRGRSRHSSPRSPPGREPASRRWRRS